MPDRIQATGAIVDGFAILNHGFVCSYILDAGASLVAIDGGMDPRRLVAEMAKAGLDPSKVSDVFLTHTDRDHVGGLGAFPNAAIHLSRAEVSMLDHSTARFLGFIHLGPARFPYDVLDDGQELRIGTASVKCIATPGHTSGSMSYLLDASILVVGDEFNLLRGKAVLDRGFISIDGKARLASIRKIAQLQGVELLCTMHSGFTRDFAEAMRDWQVG